MVLESRRGPMRQLRATPTAALKVPHGDDFSALAKFG